MSPIPPPVVKADESKPHHVFDWKIDAAVGGRPFAIKGTLDYTPPDDGGSSALPFVLIGGGVLALALVGVVVWLRRRGRRPGPPVAEAAPE
jgi:hypothetical protein